MARSHYIWDKQLGEFIPAHEFYARHPRPRPGITVIHDNMEARSMFDGEMYTSKGKYRSEMRARGFEEVGNERKALEPPPENPRQIEAEIVADIKKSMQQTGQGD